MRFLGNIEAKVDAKGQGTCVPSVSIPQDTAIRWRGEDCVAEGCLSVMSCALS